MHYRQLRALSPPSEARCALVSTYGILPLNYITINGPCADIINFVILLPGLAVQRPSLGVHGRGVCLGGLAGGVDDRTE